MRVRITFGECVLDPATRQVLREGAPVPLVPKAFDLLALLVSRRPRALPKQEIHELLWPGTFVTDSNLTSLVAELRTALRDDAKHPRFLRTVHGFGYAFCGVAEEEAAGPDRGAPATHWVCWQRREFALVPGANLLGRTHEAAVWVDAPSVSRRHASLDVEGGRVLLRDLGSRNGTWLRGERLAAPAELHDGDEFRLGRAPLTLRSVRYVGDTTSGSGP